MAGAGGKRGGAGRGDVASGGAVLVYAAGLIQGLALVCFPAASSILTSPTGYDLSASQYGLMFAPQVVLAIGSAALTPLWAGRWTLQRVLLAGLTANLVAMLLLVVSQFPAPSGAAYLLLLGATGALGFGFGSCVSALNTFAAALVPGREDRSVLTLNVLLGLGTALAPVLIAVLLPNWWLLPLGVSVALVAAIGATLRIRLSPGAVPGPAGARTRTRMPGRFWWYGAAVVLYGICETLFGNWSSLYLSGQRGLSVSVASAALAAFWACVTIGRVVVAVLPARIPPTAVYLVLPVLIVGASVAVSAATGPAAAVLAYAAAGLACSAMLPLSVSFAGREFPRLGATSSGELIAGYQVGYGVAAFGVAPLMAATGLAMSGIYLAGAAVAVALAVVALVVVRGAALRPATPPVHPAHHLDIPASDSTERS
ncbi:MFS transporter [Nakamurella sp.]|uniref:MFS transporter n=1 Tax=Nakamurella sp. TaxID=1869182 RepID=UPI003784A2F0